MKINLEINNKTRSPISRLDFRKIAERSIQKSGFDFLAEKNIEISLAFISEKEIKKINRNFRKKNESTDILSFPEYSKKEQLKNDKNKKIFLGELLMCYDNIVKYSKRHNLHLDGELAKVFSHGILHLLGFKHGEIMSEITQASIHPKFLDTI
jgi:probable rRNA maturation factor